MSAEEKQIKGLDVAYRELKGSKMVLAPKHISNILKVVAENNSIYNLIAEMVLGYDYNGELIRLDAGTTTIEDIVSSNRVIPFIFCLLNDIDNQEKEVVSVVRKFIGDDTEEAFGEFCDKIIHPFIIGVTDSLKNPDLAMADKGDVSGEESIKSIFTSELNDRIDYIVGVISEKINGMKRIDKDLKKDLSIIVYSIDLGLASGEYSGILGLLSGLKRCVIPLKKFRNEIAEIDVVLNAINNV